MVSDGRNVKCEMASDGRGSDGSGNQSKSGKAEEGKDVKQPLDTREFSGDVGLLVAVGESDHNIGRPLGGGGQYCLSSQPVEVNEKGLFWKDLSSQPLGRGQFCLPCTSLAPALLGRTLCRRLPSGAILQAEVTFVQLSRHLTFSHKQTALQKYNTTKSSKPE